MDLTPLASVIEEASTPLVRTEFSDDAAWQRVVESVAASVLDVDYEEDDEPMGANVVDIDDRAFDGLTPAALAEAVGPVEVTGYALLADARSMAEATSGGEVTVVYVDLSVVDEEDAELFDSYLGRSFRCATAEIADIEANLSIANMGFAEFANHVEDDGVFRGFTD